MQASTLSFPTAPPPPAGPPSPRSPGTGAGEFSRILDATLAEDHQVALAEGPPDVDDAKPPSKDDTAAIDLLATYPPPDPLVALSEQVPLPPPLVPQAIAASTEPMLPAASGELPGLASRSPDTLPAMGLPQPEDARQPPLQIQAQASPRPAAPMGSQPTPGGTPPQTPLTHAAAAVPPLPQTVPAALSQPPAAPAIPTQPGLAPVMPATIRVGSGPTDPHRPYANETAALFFALRSTPAVASDATDPPADTTATNDPPDTAGPPLATAPEVPPQPVDDTPLLAAIAGQPVPDRPVAPAPAAPPGTPPTLPANLAPELAAIIERNPDAPVEISLSPDELGKLRVSLWQDGSGLRVVVQAERAETLDLLRRNGEQLMQEIRASGFAGGSLSFGHWGGPPNRSVPAATALQPEVSTLENIRAPLPRPPATLAASAGLDLRY